MATIGHEGDVDAVLGALCAHADPRVRFGAAALVEELGGPATAVELVARAAHGDLGAEEALTAYVSARGWPRVAAELALWPRHVPTFFEAIGADVERA